MLTIFISKTEVAGTMTLTPPCRVRVLLRNLISHFVICFRLVARFRWLTPWNGSWTLRRMNGSMTRLQTRSWPRPPRSCGRMYTWVDYMRKKHPTCRPSHHLPLQPFWASLWAHGTFLRSPCQIILRSPCQPSRWNPCPPVCRQPSPSQTFR